MDLRVTVKTDSMKQGNYLHMFRIRLRKRSKHEFVVLNQMDDTICRESE